TWIDREIYNIYDRIYCSKKTDIDFPQSVRVALATFNVYINLNVRFFCIDVNNIDIDTMNISVIGSRYIFMSSIDWPNQSNNKKKKCN
ncbi:hypothetical protein DERF_011422, partial [Dermatophagoides farinae]